MHPRLGASLGFFSFDVGVALLVRLQHSSRSVGSSRNRSVAKAAVRAAWRWLHAADQDTAKWPPGRAWAQQASKRGFGDAQYPQTAAWSHYQPRTQKRRQQRRGRHKPAYLR